jgi:PAS domain S-box-containing protein
MLKKFPAILTVLIIVMTSVLITNVVFLIHMNQGTIVSAKEDYAIFENDIFQHSIFLNRSIVTIHALLYSENLKNSFYKSKKKLDAYTRAVLGHQSINMQIYLKIIDRLPSEDPLHLKDQITEIRPEMVELIEMISALNGKIRKSTSSQDLEQVLLQYYTPLFDALTLLKNALNIHSQVKSSFFKVLKENSLETIDRVSLNLKLLIFLICLLCLFTILFFIEQRRNHRLLQQANENLELIVQKRTEELEIKNRNLEVEIRDRRIVEKELIEIEERFRALFDNAADALTIHNVENGQIVMANNEAVNRWGYTFEELLKMSPKDLNPPEKATEVPDRIKKTLQNKSHLFETSHQCKDGSLIPTEVNVKIINVQGTQYMFSISRDISERIKSEIELQRIKLAIDQSSDAIGMATAGGQHFYQNNTFTQLFGYDLSEVIAMHPKKLYQDQNIADHVFETIMGGADWTGQIKMVSKDGRQIPIELRANAIKDEHGKIVGLAGIHSDITKRLELEARLLRSQKMEAIGNLAGGIAHDFNNILSSIIGFTELALDDVDKDSLIEDNLQEVYTAGKRAKDLVAQILAFARQSEKEMKPIRVNSIVKEVLQFIRSSIPTDIEIKKTINSDSLILGNQTQVHQVMMNLCTNAAQAMEDDGGTLDVTLTDIVVHKSNSKNLDLKPGNYVNLSVTDTGTGIPPDIIDSIFEPYFTTKDPGEGTGMGLAMVQGIIESHGGKIAVSSTLGHGTTFTAYFPITRKRKIQRQYEPEDLPSGTERILFVDDEAPIARMGSQGLERLGYQVTTRTSSVEALELFRSKPHEFDLVITDMTMPNMTGDKLTIELMKIKPDIPVILCTGYSKKISDETGFEIGIKAFAYKPIIKADLAKTVRKVLDEAKG